MAISLFLHIDGIDGEAQVSDPPYRNNIEVQSWTWGATGIGSVIPGPAAPGRASVQSLTCTKWVDRATPKIYESLLEGKRIAQCVLSCVKQIGPGATAKFDRFLILTMGDCMISNVVTGSKTGEDRMTESVTIHFGRVQIDYFYRDPAGQLTPVTFKWDLIRPV